MADTRAPVRKTADVVARPQLQLDASRPPRVEGRTPYGFRPRVPHTTFLREFQMPGGRKLCIDRRSIAFVCEANAEEFQGHEHVTIIGFKTMAKACPVTADYEDVKAWWREEGAAK
jgi:hypothetical protein